MPAGSEATPALPHRYRPFGVRMVGSVAGLALLTVAVGFWVAIPDDVRDAFSTFQRATLVVVGLLAAACGHALLRSRLDVADDTVVVVNGYRRRVLEWNEVLAIHLPRGAPWAGLDLADGTSIPVMGIQASDGDRARTAVRQFRRLLDQQTGAPPDA